MNDHFSEQSGFTKQPQRRCGPMPSILDTVGNTPVVRLGTLAPPHVELYAKLEAFNPMGSIKDRLALAVIEDAERSGALRPGQTVVEATSGNTGLGLAMVCARKGYPLVIVMAESFSLERRKLLRFLGAKVILTPAAIRGTGMFRMAERLAETHDWFFCRQFENEANAAAHSQTTAQEILADFDGHPLDYWVSGFGTGGTLKGVANTLKQKNPLTKIVVAEPENSQILFSPMEQQRREDGAPSRSHPNARSHPVQGWSPDFVPKLAEDAVQSGCVDMLQPVSGAEALDVARELAQKEGILCGISGGATVAAALAVARKAPSGSRILAMIPDTGERYLSTVLFDDVPLEMTQEEQEIATSVPTDVRAPAKDTSSLKPAINEAARLFVQEVVKNPAKPIVMFGFEWCEFCWSVRRLLTDAKIPFASIDVDSADFRQNDRGGDVLRALFERTGQRTVPQVFVAGELLGGATETLSEVADGRFAKRLAGLREPLEMPKISHPFEYLPKWARRPSSVDETVSHGSKQ